MNQRVPKSVVMMIMGCLFIAALSAVAGAATINVRHSYELGTFLVGDDDLTLYLFTPDGRGESTCYGGCAIIWPPMLVDSLDDLTVPDNLEGEFGLTERTDGTLQVTYNGLPLYYWIADNEPGDVTGQDVDNAWYVINPEPSVRAVQDDEHGLILVTGLGMTLYSFANDDEYVSNCSGGCMFNWPPLIVSFGEPTAGDGVDGEISFITREDGARQVVYNGMPLYRWINDQQPGDTTGHGVGGNWFVVNP